MNRDLNPWSLWLFYVINWVSKIWYMETQELVVGCQGLYSQWQLVKYESTTKSKISILKSCEVKLIFH